jgi:hypothetical protein
MIDLLRASIKECAPGREIRLVPASQWVQELENLTQNADEKTINTVVGVTFDGN